MTCKTSIRSRAMEFSGPHDLPGVFAELPVPVGHPAEKAQSRRNRASLTSDA